MSGFTGLYFGDPAAPAAVQAQGLSAVQASTGEVLAAIARWGAQQGRVVPVYFIGVGETLDDLQTFSALEFAQALVA